MDRDFIYQKPTEKQNLEEKLNYLSTVKRKEITEKLREATSEKSDVEDNVAYEEAKTEQGFLEWHIREIDNLLRNPIIIEQETSNGIARIGSTVTIQEHLNQRETYMIVGTTEANPRAGRIS